MARMEPENNIEMILDGYCLTKSEKKFIVIGNTSNGFGTRLVEKYKNEKILSLLAAFSTKRKYKA